MDCGFEGWRNRCRIEAHIEIARRMAHVAECRVVGYCRMVAEGWHNVLDLLSGSLTMLRIEARRR